MFARLSILLLGLFLGVQALATPIIDHAIGVYVSPRGQEYFRNNLDDLLERNGYALDNIYFEQERMELPEGTLEDILPDGELKDVVIQLRDTLARYFIGLAFEKHKFSIDLNQLEANLGWEKMGISFFEPLRELGPENYTMGMMIELETSDLEFKAGSILARDELIPWLGDLGVNGLSLMTKAESESFILQIPVYMAVKKGENPVIRVQEPITNVDRLMLELGHQSPLVLPQVQIRINDHVATLNLEEIERTLNERKDELVAEAQAQLQMWLSTEAPAALNKILDEQIGRLREVNQMIPPGAPTDEPVEPYTWTLDFQDLNFVNENVHVGVGIKVEDPLFPDKELVALEQVKTNPDSNLIPSNENDITLTVKEDLINRFLFLAFQRGYVSDIDFEGEKIKVTRLPVIKLTGDDEAKISTEIEYKVTGFAAVFVRNPVRVSFDAYFNFRANEDGKAQILFNRVDTASIFIADRYIRVFKDTVRKVVKGFVDDLQQDMRGDVLVDDLGLPTTVAGLPIKVVGTRVDPRGHLIVQVDYNFKF